MASSSTSPRAGGRSSPSFPRRFSSSTPTTRFSGSSARGREPTVTYGLDDPRHARESLQHAADSKYCLVCGAPYVYAAPYVGHLGDYRCPSCHASRLPLDTAARDIDLHGLDGTAFTLETPAGSARVELSLPGLYNVYNATAAAATAITLGVPPEGIAAGLRRFTAAFGRFERIDAGDRRLLMLLIKNPAGANEAVRTLLDGQPPRLAMVALNDGIADGRDVSWVWDVDFEPLLGGLDRAVVSGDRAAELALRFAYGGLARDRIEVVPDLEEALDLSARPSRPRRRARRPPHLHRDARAARDRRRARARAGVLGMSRRLDGGSDVAAALGSARVWTEAPACPAPEGGRRT